MAKEKKINAQKEKEALDSTAYRRVLVVDDDEGVRRMLSVMLKREGYLVTAVSGGKEALKALDTSGYDVVLSDVRMPDMDGLELLDEVIENHSDATVILMSAYGNVDSALEAIKKGAYDYISKPFKKDEVILVLKKAEERERLRTENKRLRKALGREVGFGDFVGRSEKMQEIFLTIRKITDYKTTVLVTGESGTGKELVARWVHKLSPRANAMFVPVNCGAIPEQLLESELFGHKKGAFTDAANDKVGLFAEADGGTLFLDEVGELPLGLQVKLLRVLQEGNIRRLGDTKIEQVDVRIVAATAKSLTDMVNEGSFRDDLFYRLNVFPIHLPPLREHLDDLPLLVEHFIERINKRLGTQVKGISADARKKLMNYSWPGNVRELENTVQRAIILSEGDMITTRDLPAKIKEHKQEFSQAFELAGLSIKKASRIMEEDLIRKALEKTGGNKTRASKLLEISHRALLYKMKDYSIES